MDWGWLRTDETSRTNLPCAGVRKIRRRFCRARLVGRPRPTRLLLLLLPGSEVGGELRCKVASTGKMGARRPGKRIVFGYAVS